MVYRPLYPWYIVPPTQGSLTPLSMGYWPPTHGISTPYSWYMDPYSWYINPLCIKYRPLPMVYRPPYPWYIEPPTHGISKPYPWYFDPLSMVCWPPYPWYFDPSSHGILTPYLWYFDLPFPWYIDPPTHGVSKPLLWYYEPLTFGRNDGGKFTMRGFKIQWRKIDPRVTISYENWSRGQYTMEVKIPYDTGKCLLKVEHIRGHLWYRYSIAVNQVMVVTVQFSKWRL